MRRLIDFFAALLAEAGERIQRQALDLRIADLEAMLSQQLDEREALDGAIDTTAGELVAALNERDRQSLAVRLRCTNAAILPIRSHHVKTR